MEHRLKGVTVDTSVPALRRTLHSNGGSTVARPVTWLAVATVSRVAKQSLQEGCGVISNFSLPPSTVSVLNDGKWIYVFAPLAFLVTARSLVDWVLPAMRSVEKRQQGGYYPAQTFTMNLVA